MNNNLLLLCLVSILICGCESTQTAVIAEETPSLQEIAEERAKDSLNQVRNDSIRAVKDKEIEYMLRPWHLNTFVDNFGDPTSEKYVVHMVDGLFSNSATSNSYLLAKVLLTKTAAGIFLHEYEMDGPAKKFIGSAQIQMKNSANKKVIINTSREWNQQGGIRIENWAAVEQYDFSKFRNFLKESVGNIKVVIFDDYSSTYTFEIDATGFAEEFSQI